MKILIAYSSNTGTAENCVKHLSSQISNHNVFTVDLSKNRPDVSEFDAVIIGGSIRMGSLDKKVYSFISENRSKLLNMKTAYFICNAINAETDKYFKKCFPADVIENAVIYDTFGGELKLDKQKGIDKLLLKLFLKANEENEDFAMPGILTEAINRFAETIKIKFME